MNQPKCFNSGSNRPSAKPVKGGGLSVRDGHRGSPLPLRADLLPQSPLTVGSQGGLHWRKWQHYGDHGVNRNGPKGRQCHGPMSRQTSWRSWRRRQFASELLKHTKRSFYSCSRFTVAKHSVWPPLTESDRFDLVKPFPGSSIC